MTFPLLPMQVTNIKGSELKGADFPVSWCWRDEVHAQEPGQGTHRYAFLVYQQPGYQSVEPPAKRANFQVGGWERLAWRACRGCVGRAGRWSGALGAGRLARVTLHGLPC